MKKFAILLVVLCMVLGLCACGDNTKTETADNTEATVVTEEATEEVTEAPTEAPTEAATEVATEKETITEEDAIKMVEDKYQFGDGYSYSVRRTEEIDGVSYYGVDLRKIMEDHATYYTTYFVATDGSEILEGYYENDVPVIAE